MAGLHRFNEKRLVRLAASEVPLFWKKAGKKLFTF
jgi:hypothetical protein